MGSTDYLNQVVMTMDSFFKGLSDCGLLTTYEIQFQNRNIFDSAFQKQFRLVVDEFITDLQTLFHNVGITNDEEITLSVSTKGKVIPIMMKLNEDIYDVELATLETNDELANLESNESSTIVVDQIPMANLEALRNEGSELLTATIENEEIEPETKPVEKVLSIVCANKETSEITEQWQLSILNNEEEDTAIDTITEVMTKNHLKGMGWQCDMCSKTFSRMQNLQEHCREEHNGTGCFECNLCGTRVMTKLSLRRHIQSHSGIKTSACSICKKTFKRSDYLATHYKLHLGARTHKCSVCGKEFISKTNLKLHEKVHSDHKEYICQQCNKSFTRRDKLRDHMLRHLNIKRFQCSLCDKRYAEKRDLRTHLKTHTNQAL